MQVVEYIKQHRKDWREKLTASPFNLIVKNGEGDFSDLVVLRYNLIESQMGNPIVKECRGLILDEGDDYNVVCHSFDKFFNYGEPEADNIDWKTARVQEKIDGSIIKVFYWERKDRWVVSTNGVIDAYSVELRSVFYPDAPKDGCPFFSFGELFAACCNDEKFSICKLLKGKTYSFELVSPYNKVVVYYPERKIYHIGTRDNATGLEENIDIGIPKPKEYPLRSLKAVLAAAEQLNKKDDDSDKSITDEGFVVVDGNWHRVKIKSPLYLTAHYMTNKTLTFKNALDILRSGEEEEYVAYFPETREVLDYVRTAIVNLCNLLDLGWQFVETFCPNPKEEPKLFAESIKDMEWRGFYFLKVKHPELTPQEYLFGGRKYIAADGTEKESSGIGHVDKILERFAKLDHSQYKM